MRFAAPVELKVGDRVRLWQEVNGAKDGKGRIGRGKAEYGVVVKTARGRLAGGAGSDWQDCYVAFWGFAPHAVRDQLGPKPYILRYHYTSLEKL